jgi:hypothetical protein
VELEELVDPEEVEAVLVLWRMVLMEPPTGGGGGGIGGHLRGAGGSGIVIIAYPS